MLADLLRTASLALACVGTAYYVLSTLALCRHFRRRCSGPATDYLPPVSVLKPVAGLDAGAGKNFASHLNQDYPDYEVLFGVLDPEDPAAPVLERTAAGCERASFHAGSKIGGSNNKVRILHNLAGRARGEVLVITDADTRVTPDFLRRMVAPLADPEVGLVTCLYKGVRPRGLPDVLESLHMTCVWSPSVSAAQALGGVSFGLGAAIAIKRSVLRRIGGFESIVDYLADDFHLGRRAWLLGCDVVLSDYVVDIVLSGGSFRELLAREVRWARTTRAGNRAGYVGYGVTFGTAWGLIYWLLSGLSATAAGVLLGVLAVRAASAWACAGAVGDKGAAGRIALVGVRDVVSFGTWISGFLSDRVKWRGRKLRVLRDGRMVCRK